MRRSCDSFCVHKLQETTFVCNIAIDNFCLHYCIWQLFFVPQLSTSLCIILIADVFIEYCNWDLLYERLHLRTFVCIIAILIDNICMCYHNRYLICTIEFDKLFAPLKFTTFIFAIVFITRLYSIHYNICQVLISYYRVHI